MTALTLWLTSGAILLLALGILLWQNAQLHLRQYATSVFVDQQIRSAVSTQNGTTAEESEQLTLSQPRLESNIWRRFCLRAGITPTPIFYAFLIIPGLLLISLAAIFGGILSVLGTLFLYVTLVYFRLWLKATRRHQKMVRQLPAFLDLSLIHI